MWLKRIVKILLLLVALFILLIALFIGSVVVGIFGPLPTENELKGITNEEASLVYAADGTLIGKYFAENRTNIKWEELPHSLIQALIATEDRRFFEHEGIDSRSYLRVLVKTLLMRDKSSGGGSTITQQLVKNLYGRDDHGFLSLPVSKVREAVIAYRMEKVLSKQDILLLYLNSVPFGEEVYGVEAAAKRFFDKRTSELQVEESAVLVGILKANTWYNPRLHPENARARRNQVLLLMAEAEYLTKEQAARLMDMDLKLKYINYQLESPAGYFTYQVKKRALEILEKIRDSNDIPYDLYKDGLRIYTTLDYKLQLMANQAAQKQLAAMQPLLDNELKNRRARRKWESELLNGKPIPEAWKEKHAVEVIIPGGMGTEQMSRVDSLWYYYKMLHAAVLAIEPTSGKVLAWRGGNSFRYLPYDMVLAERQIASTVKPFLYAAALEQGFQPCDYFDNSLKVYDEYDGWTPENYDKSHDEKMKVAMWYALSRSLNLPTVDLYFQTGHDEVADLIRRMGIRAPYQETPAMALGALDASLYQMTKAYAAFANGGLLPDELVIIDRITDAAGNELYREPRTGYNRVINDSVADEITGMLEIAIAEGTGRKMVTKYGIQSDLAGKTGTAQNYRDAWFFCYTPGLVLGTWVGASSPEMHFSGGKGSGSVLALPVAGEILQNVQADWSERAKYMDSFAWDYPARDTSECPPFREKGISGVLHRMIGKEVPAADREVDADTLPKTEKKERSKFRKFFDNIFRKKDKSDKKKDD